MKDLIKVLSFLILILLSSCSTITTDNFTLWRDIQVDDILSLHSHSESDGITFKSPVYKSPDNTDLQIHIFQPESEEVNGSSIIFFHGGG